MEKLNKNTSFWLLNQHPHLQATVELFSVSHLLMFGMLSHDQSVTPVCFWFALQMVVNFTSPILHPTRNALNFNKYKSVYSEWTQRLCQIYLFKRRHYCSAPRLDNWPRNCAALVSWVLPYTTWYMPLINVLWYTTWNATDRVTHPLLRAYCSTVVTVGSISGLHIILPAKEVTMAYNLDLVHF